MTFCMVALLLKQMVASVIHAHSALSSVVDVKEIAIQN